MLKEGPCKLEKNRLFSLFYRSWTSINHNPKPGIGVQASTLPAVLLPNWTPVCYNHRVTMLKTKWKHSPSLTPENSLASGKCLQVGKSATITQDTLFSLAWCFYCDANLEENILSCHEKNCNPSIGPAYVHQKHKCCCGKPRNPLAPLPKKTCSTNALLPFSELQNHNLVEVGSDVYRSSGPAPC